MKRIVTAVLSFLLVFSLAVVAYADVIIDIDDWSIAKTPSNKAWEIRSYNGEDTEITLLDSYGLLNVTSLGPQAFANNESIIGVTMNQHLQSVKEYAFLNSAVSTIVLNKNLYHIGKGAFSGTALLKEINLQDTGVQAIEEYTFLNSGLESIVIPDTVQMIGTGAFMQCTDLTKAEIPDTVTSIADDAFYGCSNLTIYANSGSYAIEYAQSHDIPYSAIETVTYILGDADHDSTISVLDATAIQKYLAMLLPDEDGWINMAGSVDGLALNVTHATYIQKYLAHIDVPYEIGKEIVLVIE